jgi:hypothetical protein
MTTAKNIFEWCCIAAVTAVFLFFGSPLMIYAAIQERFSRRKSETCSQCFGLGQTAWTGLSAERMFTGCVGNATAKALIIGAKKTSFS